MKNSIRIHGAGSWISAFTLHIKRNNYEQIEITCQPDMCFGRYKCKIHSGEREGKLDVSIQTEIIILLKIHSNSISYL